MSERKRPRVRLKRENCYHYLGKAKKVQSRGKKRFSMRRNNQDGYFSARYRCSLALSKLMVPIILQEGDTEKERGTEGPIVRRAHIKHCDIVAVKWQFCLVQAGFIFLQSDAPLCFFSAFNRWRGPDHYHINWLLHICCNCFLYSISILKLSCIHTSLRSLYQMPFFSRVIEPIFNIFSSAIHQINPNECCGHASPVSFHCDQCFR